MRVLLFSQLNQRVNFFVETDNPNLGKQGDFSSRTFVQDAWVEFNLHDALQIDMGMLLVPFSHHGMQGAVSLHSLDYHADLIRYPTGSHTVWRDFRVMVRGLLWEDLIEYRLAVLNGVHGGAGDPRNPNDWQKDLNVDLDTNGALERRGDYFALSADLFWDLPLDAGRRLGLSGQVNFYYYDHGDRERSFYAAGERFHSEYTGYGLLSEAGMRYDAFEVLLSLDWFEATRADGSAGDLLSVYGGLNFWWFGHATSIKLQAGETKKDGGDWRFFGQIQVQLLF